MMWTNYMDECVQTLDEKEECAADKVLVLLTKLQRIAEKVRQSPWHDECRSPESASFDAASALLSYIARIRARRREAPGPRASMAKNGNCGLRFVSKVGGWFGPAD